MKRLLCLCALTLALLGLSACAGGFLDASQIEALAKDPASVCVSVTTPYGNMKFARTNLIQGSVTCDANGQTVESEAARVGVPLLVTPQISIGTPTVTPR